MKGERYKEEKIQTKLAHLLKKLNHKKESLEEHIRCIETEQDNFYIDTTRVKAGYESAEAYKMMKNVKEDQALDDLLEQYDSEIKDSIERDREEREEENYSGTSNKNTLLESTNKRKKEISVSLTNCHQNR